MSNEENEIKDYTFLEEIPVKGFTKVTKTRAMKALLIAGKTLRVGSLLKAWKNTIDRTEVKHPSDRDIACWLVLGYPTWDGCNPYGGDKVYEYVAALFQTIKEKNPGLVEQYLKEPAPQMKIYIVSYILKMTEDGTNMSFTSVYNGYSSVWQVLRKLYDDYGYYPFINNIYCETLPSDVSEVLHFLYGNGAKNYTTKEWFENYDMALKYLESTKKK